ncbi:MAG: TfoX/Sxy family protein [Gammaproteobacteria bacterium]
MPITQEQKDFSTWVVDMLQGMGPVRSKRMFGGFGIFLDELMFGLIADNELYFKVDDENRAEFEEHDLMPFTYVKADREMKLSYYQAPAEALDNMEIMLEWGNRGFAAAVRAASGKRKAKGQ